MIVHYHPVKVNVVVHSFSRLFMGSAEHLEEKQKELVKDVHRLAILGVQLMCISDAGVTIQNGEESSFDKESAGKVRQ